MSVPVYYCCQRSCVVDLRLFSDPHMTDSYKYLSINIHYRCCRCHNCIMFDLLTRVWMQTFIPGNHYSNSHCDLVIDDIAVNRGFQSPNFCIGDPVLLCNTVLLGTTWMSLSNGISFYKTALLGCLISVQRLYWGVSASLQFLVLSVFVSQSVCILQYSTFCHSGQKCCIWQLLALFTAWQMEIYCGLRLTHEWWLDIRISTLIRYRYDIDQIPWCR